nr:phospholipase-like protein [Tanacetum cinerariifolium]
TKTSLDLLGVIEDEEYFSKLCDVDAIRVCLLLCLKVLGLERNGGVVEKLKFGNEFCHLSGEFYDELNHDFLELFESAICKSVGTQLDADTEEVFDALEEEERLFLEEDRLIEGEKGYFVQLLLQTAMPLWYANEESGDSYDVEWRDWYIYTRDCLQGRLPEVLYPFNVFDKKRIDKSTYHITFRIGENLPKQRVYLVTAGC